MGDSRKEDRFFNRERETMDWERRKADLNTRFLKTFRHACENSTAYRDIFTSSGIGVSDIRSIDDIEKLPILRISDLVDRQKRDMPFGGFETADFEEIRRIYINPGLIWQPGERDYHDTTWAEALCGVGFKEGDRIINTFNYHMWPLAFMLDESLRIIGATVIPTGVGNTLMQVKIMQTLRVTGFIGTPSFIMTLIQRAEAMGLDLKKDLCLETALVGAEMLPESLRSRIEDKLEMTVRQVYGTVFLGCIGYECRHMTGLHVPDDMLVEVVDPHTGKQVEPGATGEVVATNFNTYYPMIRMGTGDLSMMSLESCPCGRTGPVLKRILGRVDQATKVKGTFVHPWQADEVISRYPEVFKYQVVVTREDHKDVMTFVVELREEISKPDIIRARIERDIKELLTIKGTVQIVPPGTIPDLHKKIEDRRTWE
ncbi:MAG: AMP-binding protein [Deltaproteobacteria bacterium]|nr:AMP-binding protein [Deltaproteobacteria bacterium]